MCRKLTSVVAALFLIVCTLYPQSQEPQTISPGEWIRSWLLCGPVPLQKPDNQFLLHEHLTGFTTDYLAKTGGEENPSVREGGVIRFRNGSAKWKRYVSPDSLIDLDRAVSAKDNVLMYAYNEVFADSAGIWFISFGTNDGGSLWINGIKTWDNARSKRLSADNNLIPVALRKGKNTILFKIEERGNRWGFIARFLPFSTEKMLSRGSPLTITTGADGNAMIISAVDADVLKQLVKGLDIEVVDHNNKVVLNEQRASDFCGILDIQSERFQSYTASLGISLRNGDYFRYDADFNAGKRTEYTLFANGRSDYTIILGKEASDSEKWVAGELQHWLGQISGTEIPVADREDQIKGPKIILGYNDLVGKITGKAEPPLSDESFRYFNNGSDIIIYGGKARGTMYGVMSFLENEFGCRWYTPAVSSVPEKERYVFTTLDHSEKPGVRVRNDFYFEAFDPVWAARNRMNGAMSDRKQPGGVESYWSVHTFYPLMPPSEFFSTHPEYYSLIDGQRTWDHAQLCLSNPDVLKIVTERIKNRMRENPEYLIYDVSQNDWRNPCQCEKCQAIVKKEGSESGIIIWFVNQVAEAVEKEFPDKFIGTLAYQYTRTPPKFIHPRNNVVVRLCSIECCFSHDFKSCPENQSFLKDLKEWSAIAPHMYIWDYVVNFSHYIMPFPNFKVLQSNIKTFAENNSIGIMEQAAYQGRGGEFSELRAYLLARLLWDPGCNTEDVIDDFMYGYYGRSGRYIKEYFDLLHGQIRPDTHIHLGLSPDDQIFTDQFISEASKIFEKAMKISDNEDILRRVRITSLPLLYLKCKRSPVLSKYDGTYKDFCTIVRQEGIEFYAESGEPHRISFHREVEDAE